jgi:hypothetical protein
MRKRESSWFFVFGAPLLVRLWFTTLGLREGAKSLNKKITLSAQTSFLWVVTNANGLVLQTFY